MKEIFEIIEVMNKFKLSFEVDWDGETIGYYHPETSQVCEHIEQVQNGWTFQDQKTQEKYNQFLLEIEEEEDILPLISQMEVNEILTSLPRKIIKRVN